ncbi:MAG TPA: GTP cyclohydrolase II [Bryobacteraceae bacterium]|jgi:GTP cyclohydrolase II
MQGNTNARLEKVAEADFPTEFGHFRIYGFEGRSDAGTEEFVAIAMGDLADDRPVLARIHSQCLTGDVFHSLRCDCRTQLELAISSVAAAGRGLIIYEPKEGRGIGLLNKLRAYELQDGGADTVEANESLGFEADLRDYELAGQIFRFFGIREVRLMSNNPKKIEALESTGVRVVERVPIIAPPRESTEDYLRTKKEKMGHLI